MRCKKARPGTTTQHANCSVPMSDWSSRKVHDFFDSQTERSGFVHVSLSTGKLAIIFCEFRRTPRNSSSVDAGNVLWCAIGTFRFVIRVSNLHEDIMQFDLGGGSIRKKSSKICKIFFISWLVLAIHSIASGS